MDEAEDKAKAPGGTNAFFFFKLRGGTPSPTAVGYTLQPYNHKVSYATAWDDEADVELDAEADAEGGAEGVNRCQTSDKSF